MVFRRSGCTAPHHRHSLCVVLLMPFKILPHNFLLTCTSSLWELRGIKGNEGNWPAVSSSSAHPPSVLLEKSGSLGDEKFSSEAGATSQSVLHCTAHGMTVLLLTQVEEDGLFLHVPCVK